MSESETGWLRGRSRQVQTTDPDGTIRRWHVLDSSADRSLDELRDDARPTLICVHGNPTWSYLWRRVLAQAPSSWRVVAPDQLGMGWSDRLERPRRLGERIDDLDRLLDALAVTGPVALLVHDWGGPVGLGWAVRLVRRGERDRLRGLLLTNTAVHQPDRPAPGLIRAARSTALRRLTTETTPVFVRAAAALSRPRLDPEVRRRLAEPYRTAARRGSVSDFVADIPLEADHPSRTELDAVAAGLRELVDVAALVVWGARDPVFTDVHLADLLERLPQADVQRYARASHLVTEDVPEVAELVWRWIHALDAANGGSTPAGTSNRPQDPQLDRWSGPSLRALPRPAEDPAAVAVLELRETGTGRKTSWAQLESRVEQFAAGLRRLGVRPGQRVAVLVPPGADLTAVVYACWRVGASIVVTDAGLGVRTLAASLRSADPDHLIGIGKALVAAQTFSIPGRRHRLSDLTSGVGALSPPAAFPGSADDGPAESTDELAVLFTSGATGPPKGVVYTADRLRAQIAAVGALIDVRPEDRLVAAFPPFALYGPALGLPAVVPAMDPTRPASLTASALAAAVEALRASVVFASPAALATVVASSDRLSPDQREALTSVRLVLSAGAPVGLPLLGRLADLLPNAELHTPYGMTEMLPATDVTFDELRSAGTGDGTLVGRPLPGVTVRIAALDHTGVPAGDLSDRPGVSGEIVLTGPHLKSRYDRLWAVQSASERPAGWHRTGDVGHLDEDGRLWVQGRLAHVITTVTGPVTPVGPEQRLELLPQVRQAALVGVGPSGNQQPVAVLVLQPSPTQPGPTQSGPAQSGVLAPSTLSAAARSAVDDLVSTPLAAVLLTARLPTDVRHQAKIDRSAVAAWAERALAGRRPGRLR